MHWDTKQYRTDLNGDDIKRAEKKLARERKEANTMELVVMAEGIVKQGEKLAYRIKHILSPIWDVEAFHSSSGGSKSFLFSL